MAGSCFLYSFCYNYPQVGYRFASPAMLSLRDRRYKCRTCE